MQMVDLYHYSGLILVVRLYCSDLQEVRTIIVRNIVMFLVLRTITLPLMQMILSSKLLCGACT